MDPNAVLTLRRHGLVTPRLLVLAMGWSWSLFFCQRMVEDAVVAAGFPAADLIRGRHSCRPLEEGPLVAVYVDGVAVLATTTAEADRLCERVDSIPEVRGLAYKGVIAVGEG